MTRLSVDGAQVFIVEHGCAANIKVSLLCVSAYICVCVCTSTSSRYPLSATPHLFPPFILVLETMKAGGGVY